MFLARDLIAVLCLYTLGCVRTICHRVAHEENGRGIGCNKPKMQRSWPALLVRCDIPFWRSLEVLG
jgi:hypothetical protein